jgi:hypothetical protein
MKRIIILVTLITASSVSVLCQSSGSKSAGNEKAKKEVIALANEYATALIKRDATTMERILSDDYVDLYKGMPMTKFLMIRFCKEMEADAPRPEAINLNENLNIVRVYDNAAVLVTRITLKWSGSKQELAKKWGYMMPMFDEYLVTLVAVRNGGNWQIVSTHESEWAEKIQVSPKR